MTNAVEELLLRANPVLDPEEVRLSPEEANARCSSILEGRVAMQTQTQTKAPADEFVSRRWSRPVLAFAIGLLAIIVAAGVVFVLLAGNDPDVAETPAVTTTPTTIPSTAVPTTMPSTTQSILTSRTGGPVPPVAACPPDSQPGEPGPADQDRPPPSRYWTRAAIDEQSGVMVLLAETERDGSRTWTFDLCTNTWQLMHPDREPPSWPEVYAVVVYDRDSDRTILVEDSVWSYDVETDTWTHHGPPPSAARYKLAYHDPSGLVLAADLETMTLWAYDVDSNTWTAVERGSALPPVGQQGQSGYIYYPASQILGYDSSADLLVLYMGDNCYGEGPLDGCGTQLTWTFDPNSGRWSEQETVTPEVDNFVGGQAAFDGASGRLVVFADGTLIAYDARAREWEVLYSSVPDWDGLTRGPFNRSGNVMAFDPVNQRLVIAGGTARMLSGEPNQDGMPLPTTHQDRNDVWAFDTRTGEWKVLLDQDE